MSNQANLVYRDSGLREGSAVQVQLAENLLIELVTHLLKRMLQDIIQQPCRMPCHRQRRVKGSMIDFDVVKK